jgi:hypothetical protein
MAWVKLDDKFAEHPKVVQAGPVAGFLYVAGLCYANRHLTNGFIPAAHVTALLTRDGVNSAQLSKRLCAVGLWSETTKKETPGFLIHDYLQFQPSRASVIKARKTNAKRQATWRKQHLAQNGRVTP